jgi:hypothetical protein
MGFDDAGADIYQVNYNYSPSEWRRMFEKRRIITGQVKAMCITSP